MEWSSWCCMWSGFVLGEIVEKNICVKVAKIEPCLIFIKRMWSSSCGKREMVTMWTSRVLFWSCEIVAYVMFIVIMVKCRGWLTEVNVLKHVRLICVYDLYPCVIAQEHHLFEWLASIQYSEQFCSLKLMWSKDVIFTNGQHPICYNTLNIFTVNASRATKNNQMKNKKSQSSCFILPNWNFYLKYKLHTFFFKI
jgi:hypothetical protein